MKYAEKQPREGDVWFKKLVDSGQAEAYDWDTEGDRRDDLGARRDAAINYEMAAAQAKRLWSDWCYAALSWSAAGDDRVSSTPQNGDINELALMDARKCVSVGVDEKQSEHPLAIAHEVIAEVSCHSGSFRPSSY